MPLPPYIAARRPADDRDRTDYQTLFAREEGAVAAPTAGLHFTPELMRRLEARGIGHATVTLHVGAGTFLPVKADDTSDHLMHYETGHIDAVTAAALNAAKARGNKVISVGTTSLRLLESAADENGHLAAWSGNTNIFTNYLAKVSPDWQSQVGNATSVNWPSGLGGQGNAGVAGEVKANDGAIGYVELAYAIQNTMPYATMKNASGNWVVPSIESTTAAADGVALPDDMKVMITNSSNPAAYPIAGFTWILASKEQADQAKGKALVDFDMKPVD